MANVGRPGQCYRIIDRTGTTVAEGSATECAKQMGRSVSYIYKLISGHCSYPEYWAFPILPPGDNDISAAVKKWDDFVTPIREDYGVPRYRPNKEGIFE